jgi:hypothetical protein
LWRPKSLTTPTGHHHSWRRTGEKSNRCSNDHNKTQKPCTRVGASAQEELSNQVALEVDQQSSTCTHKSAGMRNSLRATARSGKRMPPRPKELWGAIAQMQMDHQVDLCVCVCVCVCVCGTGYIDRVGAQECSEAQRLCKMQV